MEIAKFAVDPIQASLSLAKAQKLASRANKKGLQGGYQVSIEKTEDVTYLVVSGSPYSIGGWNFVGVIEWIPAEEVFITKVAPTYKGVEIDRSIIKQNACDHCGINRKRNYQVVVENAEGVRKVVGSTCVKDFLGWSYSPVIFDDFENEIASQFGGGGSGYETSVYTLEKALVVVNEIVGGYVSASSGNSTKDNVLNYSFEVSQESKSFGGEKPFTAGLASLNSGKYTAQAEELIAKGLEFVADKNGNYFDNLKVALSSKYAFPSTIGLLISIIPVIKKAELEALKAKLEAEEKAVLEGEITIEEQFAETGAKILLTGAKVVDCVGFEGAYGWVSIYTFVAEGARFKWFSTGSFSAEVGDVVDLKATVKGLDTYGGINSTLLTRCSDANKKLAKV
jgi:hypothetical protein